MNRLEWKEKSKEYKEGYIIGCILMFFLGLISCLLTYTYPISVIPLVIGIVILRKIVNKRVKERKYKENEKNI